MGLTQSAEVRDLEPSVLCVDRRGYGLAPTPSRMRVKGWQPQERAGECSPTRWQRKMRKWWVQQTGQAQMRAQKPAGKGLRSLLLEPEDR